MTREIKFRGKNRNGGEWVYGDLLRMNGHTCIFPDPAPGGFDRYIVDPATVGQFTGLRDMNGVEIYEGDVVDMSNCSWGAAGPAGYSKPVQSVAWDEDVNGFVPFANYDCDCDIYHSACDMVVLGNAHDNPELLK